MKASKTNNYLYNPLLQEKAKFLRNNGTKSEAVLWKYVLKNKNTKYKFLRQRPVLNYIADFMCPELLLIIELDGKTHFEEEVIKKDIVRQKELEKVGFTVIRFDDNLILNQLWIVEDIIRIEIENCTNKLFYSPNPLEGGD